MDVPTRNEILLAIMGVLLCAMSWLYYVAETERQCNSSALDITTHLIANPGAPLQFWRDVRGDLHVDIDGRQYVHPARCTGLDN